MLCERYKEALIEAAVGESLQHETRAHLAECAACRAALEEQSRLLIAIDAGLGAMSNANISANFHRRVLARIQSESASPANKSWFEPRWVFAGLCAAVILCLVLWQWPESTEVVGTGDGEGPSVVAKDEVSAIPHQAEREGSVRTRRTVRKGATFVEGEEVLVAAQEAAALTSYMKVLNAAEAHPAMSVELEHKVELAAKGVQGVEISELVVAPLSDLGAGK